MFSRLIKRTVDAGGSPDALIREMFKRPEPPTVIDTSSKAQDDLSEMHSVAGGQPVASQQRSGLLQRLQHSMNPTRHIFSIRNSPPYRLGQRLPWQVWQVTSWVMIQVCPIS